MTFKEYLNAGIAALPSTAVFAGLLYLAITHWFKTRLTESVKHEYSLQIEQHKAELTKSTQTAIEETKAKLSQESQKVIEQYKKDLEVRFIVVTQELEHDRELFTLFTQQFPSEEDIKLLVNVPYTTFYKKNIKGIDEFAGNWNNAQHEFLDQSLESKRKQLVNQIIKWLQQLQIHAKPFGEEQLSVNFEPRIMSADEFKLAVATISKMAEQIRTLHQDFIRTAKRTLRISAI